MNTHRMSLLIGLLVALSAHAFKAGDTIKVTLRNGSVVTGKFVTETTSGLLINTGAKTELVQHTNIAGLDEISSVPAAAPAPVAPAPGPAPIAPAAPLPSNRRAPVGANSAQPLPQSAQPEARQPLPSYSDAPPPPPPPPQSSRRSRAARQRDPEEEVETGDDEEPIRRVRFGIGVSGGVVPAYYGIAWGLGAEAGLAFTFSDRFQLRVLANFTHTQNGPYSTNLGLAVVMATLWFGVYGIAVAPVLGFGVIERSYGGYSPGFGFAFGAFASPVRLRFGKRITNEISLDGGVLIITSDTSPSPFARLAYTIFF